MSFSLNKTLDLNPLAKAFKQSSRVQIRNLFNEDSAGRIYTALVAGTPWQVVYNEGTKVFQRSIQEMSTLTQRRHRELAESIYSRAIKSFQYLHFVYPNNTGAPLEEPDGHLLHDLLSFMNEEAFLENIRTISGIKGISKADGFATWFKRDHFLMQQADREAGDDARLAYELNFTKDWRPDYGGYLNFHDDDNDVLEAVMPRFNNMTLYKVGQPHAINYVSPFANGARVAISGFFRCK